MIEGQPQPVTLPALVQHSGLHENTVRGHLEQLLADGHIVRSQGTSTGRGRPPWLWSATRDSAQTDADDYAQLASVLAKTIHQTSPTPLTTAQQAGQEWGTKIAQSKNLAERVQAAPQTSGQEPRRVLIDLLDELGFAPQETKTGSEIDLLRCPLLQTATEYPEVVCNVHLGLVHGAAQAIGVDAQQSTLTPFSRPGVCSLHLDLTQPKEEQ